MYEIIELPSYKSDIEKILNDKSMEGWETITIFSAGLGIAEKSLFALLRKES